MSHPFRDREPHWGPTIQRLQFKGWIGAVIMIGLMFGVIMEVPAARLWIYIALPLGIVIGVILYLTRRES